MESFGLQDCGEQIWERVEWIRFFGVPLPHRMTVIRLSDGSLLIHSPTACTENSKRSLLSLGNVSHIVAPNRMHDLFIEDYASAFSDASVWIPPDSAAKFPRLRHANPLPRTVEDAQWIDDISCVLVEGIPRLNECVFFHPRSRSLICADLLFNITGRAPFLTKLLAFCGGFYERLAMPLDMRLFMVREKAALRKSLRRLEHFDFRNLIIGHGENVIGHGKEALQHATAHL